LMMCIIIERAETHIIKIDMDEIKMNVKTLLK
jgi:hypothetical protein